MASHGKDYNGYDPEQQMIEEEGQDDWVVISSMKGEKEKGNLLLLYY